MITLYHNSDSFCSFKVRMALEEKGLEWRSEHISLMNFENLSPDYLAVNPKGVVPTLVHDDRPIFESSIINEYLDDCFPTPALRPSDAVARARMRFWVKVEEDDLFTAVRPASLNLMMKQVFGNYSRAELEQRLAHHPRPHMVPRLLEMFTAPYDAAAVAASHKKLRDVFQNIDSHLSGHSWLCGDEFSLADIAAAPVIDRVERLGFTDVWQDLDNVSDWIARLTSRPAYAAAAPVDELRMPAPIAAGQRGAEA